MNLKEASEYNRRIGNDMDSKQHRDTARWLCELEVRRTLDKKVESVLDILSSGEFDLETVRKGVEILHSVNVILNYHAVENDEYRDFEDSINEKEQTD